MDEAEKILQENPCSINELAALLGCSVSKIHRLTTTGATAIDGRTVVLDIVRTESGKKTSLGAYQRFQLELNSRKEP
ncbi:MAG: hypothetical protein CMK32_08050 [Porticoccaceae bacterium]|nr:hypothetical protein [Porticoccaceae bacterium]